MRAPRSRSQASLTASLTGFVLPVSGVAIALRPLTGIEELLLAEGDIADPRLALSLAEHLGATNAITDWSDLTVTDIDVLIAHLRQALLGDRVVAELACTHCGQMVDLSFGLRAYLRHHQPHKPHGRGWTVARETPDSAWFLLRAGTEESRFRLPTLADQIAVDRRPDAEAGLAARCLRPPSLSGRPRARVERAMEALAPSLAGPLQGQCPHCGTALTARFSTRLYCLQELRDRARFIHDDVDVLAERYHWSERAILTLPQGRRSLYAERARQARAG
jgi:hypothetical protein